VSRVAAVVLFLAGCTAVPRPSGPATGARPLVLVAPVAGADFASLLVAALSETGKLRALLQKEGPRPTADALLEVAVLEFDPYDPPRLSLAVKLKRTCGGGGADLDRLSQAGAWDRGPRAPGSTVLSFVVDARDRATREEIASYARRRDPSSSGFTGDREVLAVSSEFLRFAAERLAARLAEEPLAHEP